MEQEITKTSSWTAVNEPGPHKIPHRIKEYEKYSSIQQGKLVWICNFERAPKSLKGMIEDMFAPCKLAFKKQHHMMGTYPGKSCKYQIESELTKTDNTDCFICIVSSYGNYYNICYEGKPDRDEESISTLVDIDNNLQGINTKLKNKPKILIIDLYQKGQKKSLSDSDVFKVHKDWLIVLVRHEENTFFIETLKNEIGEMHDKLDLVSILERVRCRNEKMKIIHRMPRKFFLSDELESIETKNILTSRGFRSYFDINGIIRCCFFGSKHFEDADDLNGIEKDKAHVSDMSNEFDYTLYPLDNERKAKEDFKFQLTKKDTGCHMFVFSSHGDSEGLFTRQTDNKVKFIDLVKIVRALEKKLPVVLVFDCCRIENKRDFGQSLSVSNKLLQMRNIIVVYAAVEGYTSTMFETTGSVLIKTMFEVIEKHRLKSDFLTMMECVNRKICEPCENDYTGWNKQTCVEIDSQLEKKLFLFETETATINANEQEQKETETVAFYAQATGRQETKAQAPGLEEPRQEDEPINIGAQGLVMQPGQIKWRHSV